MGRAASGAQTEMGVMEMLVLEGRRGGVSEGERERETLIAAFSLHAIVFHQPPFHISNLLVNVRSLWFDKRHLSVFRAPTKAEKIGQTVSQSSAVFGSLAGSSQLLSLASLRDTEREQSLSRCSLTHNTLLMQHQDTQEMGLFLDARRHGTGGTDRPKARHPSAWRVGSSKSRSPK